MIRSIIIYPDPVLARKCEDVSFPLHSDVLRLLDDMVETMMAARGAGLAAPQVGFNLRLVTLMVERAGPDGGTEFVPLKLVNPRITKRQGKRQVREGCLSLPGYFENVQRSTYVEVQGFDETGAKVELGADGKLAQALEHEIEHLDGITFVDHLSLIKRNMARTKFTKAKAKGLRYQSSSPPPQDFTELAPPTKISEPVIGLKE